MTVSIPSAAGVPGISGPPIWFSSEANYDPRLDDVRWRGAVKRTFGSGTGGSNFFRATQATVGPQKFIYLTFRAAFVPDLSDADDLIYFGLRRHDVPGGSMVVRVRAHGATFTPAGPPSLVNPDPTTIAEVTIWTLSGTTWNQQLMSPSWINTHARMWLQTDTQPDGDGNNRWAVQLRIPANIAGGIADDLGPNLGTDFDMWYLIHGNVGGNPTILADYRTAGTTTENDLIDTLFPQPANWDEFQLTAAAATSGGVAISWGDVVVQNSLGEGWIIDNHTNNTFVARPRNYSTASIAAGDINATFRIANWGSVVGDPNMPDFSSGSWDYVPGNSETVPVISSLAIPTIPAGNNPPATAPIALTALMNLAVPPKSLHQCILVTLSGTNLNFLNDAIFQNMNFDSASLYSEEAEISAVGLKKSGGSADHDIYLAIEKVNMPAQGHADEGVFLQASFDRVIRREGGEGPLADKLRRARDLLFPIGIAGKADAATPPGGGEAGEPGEGQDQRLQQLVKVLSEVDLTEEELDLLFPTFRVHVYHDTGERVDRPDGTERPVLKEQSSFGVYAYHEGGLEGWASSIQGAQRIEDNLYLIKVPHDGSAKVKVSVQAVQEGEDRLPEDPIQPIVYPPAKERWRWEKKGCLHALWKLFGGK